MKKGCGCALLIGLALLALLAWQAGIRRKRPARQRPRTRQPRPQRPALLWCGNGRRFPSALQCKRTGSHGHATTAGKGDRVRTPSKGKALLKWPDLQVMIYGGTDLKESIQPDVDQPDAARGHDGCRGQAGLREPPGAG